MAVLVLVRHGHSTANADGVLAGWSPGVTLTDRGREQACALGKALAGIPLAAVVTSPLERCRETTDLLLGPNHPAPVTDPRVGECHYGEWTGRRLADLTREPLWRTVQDDPEAAAFPAGADDPGESLRAMRDRLWAAVREHDDQVEAEHGPHAVWLLVSHGDPIKSVLAEALGAGLTHLQRLVVDPASVSVVRWSGGRPMVLTTNRDGTGLGPLLAAPAGAAHVPAGDAPVGGGAG